MPKKPEGGSPEFKASDHFEIRVVGAPCAEALFAARLTVLGYSRAEVREAVARLRARKAREAARPQAA